jgi:hypothetical protein
MIPPSRLFIPCIMNTCNSIIIRAQNQITPLLETKMKHYYVLVVATLFLASCTSLSRPEIHAENSAPIPPINKPAPATVFGMSDDFNIDIHGIADDGMFISMPLQQSDPLPDVTIQSFSVSNASIYEFMRAVLEGTGVSFSIDIEQPGANVMRRSVSSRNVSGTLKSVLDTFSDSFGFYFYYVGGVLHITPDRQYISKIPPVNDLFDSLPVMLKTLGANDVFIDKTSRTVTYRATKPAQNKVVSYLKWVRDKKNMIVYETYIAEVILDDATQTGIQWNNFGWTGSSHGTPVSIGVTGTSANVAAAATGSLGVGTAFTGSNFSLNVLANFLKTQGTVNQLTKIPLMLIDGGTASFHNGNTNYYVSSIGAPTISAGGQVIQGLSQLTALVTGIDVKISGDISDGTVFSTIDMSMITLTGYQSFPAGTGQTLQAPITSDRKINSSPRIRAGDTVLIAGINYDSYQANVSGLPGGLGKVDLPTDNSHAAHRSELVVVMRPKIISFTRNAVVNKEPSASLAMTTSLTADHDSPTTKKGEAK